MARLNQKTVLPYYIFPVLTLVSMWVTVNCGFTFVFMWVTFAGLPLIDLICNFESISLNETDQKLLAKQTKWIYPLYAFVLADALSYVWAIYSITTLNFSWLQIAGIALTVGHSGAVGVAVSHELIHRRSKFAKIIATLNLVRSYKSYFTIEHIETHHSKVATPLDPDSAPLGMPWYISVTQMMVRTRIGTWNLEARRMKSKGKSTFSLSNAMLWMLAAEAALTMVLLFKTCWAVIIMHFVAALVTNIIESMTQYIEHYGLTRKEIAPGVYEPVTMKHSWNAPAMAQDFMLFKIQRHSDHHANPYKPYQSLIHPVGAPEYPMGYGQILGIAFNTQKWFEIVNPLAIRAQKGEAPTTEEWETSWTKVRENTKRNIFIFSVLLLVM